MFASSPRTHSLCGRNASPVRLCRRYLISNQKDFVLHAMVLIVLTLAPRSQIIGLTKLRNNYNTFEARRALASSYDLFVADSRVCGFLPALLGKAFYKQRKYEQQAAPLLSMRRTVLR